jgi:hypothetical protein
LRVQRCPQCCPTIRERVKRKLGRSRYEDAGMLEFDIDKPGDRPLGTIDMMTGEYRPPPGIVQAQPALEELLTDATAGCHSPSTRAVSPGRGRLGQVRASLRPARTLSTSVGNVESAGRGVSDPRVVLVQYPIGEAGGWATRVGIVPNCTRVRVRADSPRHTSAVMNSEGWSGRHSQRSGHDHPGDQLPPHQFTSLLEDSVKPDGDPQCSAEDGKR